MSDRHEQGRRHAPALAARTRRLPAGATALGAPAGQGQCHALCSPNVGIVHTLARPGQQLKPGDAFAKLSQLGVEYTLQVPAGAFGQVVASALHCEGEALAQLPVQFDSELLVLDPEASGEFSAQASAAAHAQSAGGETFAAPSSGRFYQRPSPDRPPFIEVGQVIKSGQTVGLLEIMKTFTRIQFGGPGLPESVKVVELLAQDDDELASGDPIFRFEPA